MGKSNRQELAAIATRSRFGPISLSRNEAAFCRRFSREIFKLCRSLPRSVQTKAFLFLIEYLELPLGTDPDFFAHYYPPAWSVVYWLTRKNFQHGRLSERDVRAALSAHAMAMLLHLLDDHLNDGELPATHLLLVFRSQAWSIMNDALRQLASRVVGGTEIVRALLDDYYAKICSPDGVPTVDLYCELFRGQMATWTIVPLLLANRIAPGGAFPTAVRRAYESFGIAWRLLDDIQDVEKDMERGAHTSVYLSLPEELRCSWDEMRKGSKGTRDRLERLIITHILESGLIHGLKSRICKELELAESISEAHGITGLTVEFQTLAAPLKSEIPEHELSKSQEPLLVA